MIDVSKYTHLMKGAKNNELNKVHFKGNPNIPRKTKIDASKLKATLINKIKIKKPSKKTLIQDLAAGLIFFNLILAPVFHVGRVEIPNPDEVKTNIQTLGIDDTIITKMDNDILARYHKRISKGEIKVGVSDEFTNKEKQIIRETLDTYNKVFEVINPEYKFIYDSETSKLEKIDPTYICIQPTTDMSGTSEGAIAYERSGIFPTVKGVATVYNGIYMGSESRENEGMFRNTILHEFMHILGVDDAYDKPNWYQQTIMNATDSHSQTNDIYPFDVAVLASLYSNLDDPENLEKIKNFIAEYGKNSKYTDTSYYKVVETTSPNTNKNKIVEEEGMTF